VLQTLTKISAGPALDTVSNVYDKFKAIEGEITKAMGFVDQVLSLLRKLLLNNLKPMLQDFQAILLKVAKLTQEGKREESLKLFVSFKNKLRLDDAIKTLQAISGGIQRTIEQTKITSLDSIAQETSVDKTPLKAMPTILHASVGQIEFQIETSVAKSPFQTLPKLLRAFVGQLRAEAEGLVARITAIELPKLPELPPEAVAAGEILEEVFDNFADIVPPEMYGIVASSAGEFVASFRGSNAKNAMDRKQLPGDEIFVHKFKAKKKLLALSDDAGLSLHGLG
jgi:hypothetical protein